jgi:hypothetical protein
VKLAITAIVTVIVIVTTVALAVTYSGTQQPHSGVSVSQGASQ